VVVPRARQADLVSALQEHYSQFYPEGALDSTSFARIVNYAHHNRLLDVLGRTQGKISFGGKVDAKKGFEPTVVEGVRFDDALLEEYVQSVLFLRGPTSHVLGEERSLGRFCPSSLWIAFQRPSISSRLGVASSVNRSCESPDRVCHADLTL
jgi:hypothetical protein